MALEKTRKRITVESETVDKISSNKMWHKAEKSFGTFRVVLGAYREIY